MQEDRRQKDKQVVRSAHKRSVFYAEFFDPVKKGFVAHTEQSGSNFSVTLGPLESLNDGPAFHLSNMQFGYSF